MNIRKALGNESEHWEENETCSLSPIMTVLQCQALSVNCRPRWRGDMFDTLACTQLSESRCYARRNHFTKFAIGLHNNPRPNESFRSHEEVSSPVTVQVFTPSSVPWNYFLLSMSSFFLSRSDRHNICWTWVAAPSFSFEASRHHQTHIDEFLCHKSFLFLRIIYCSSNSHRYRMCHPSTFRAEIQNRSSIICNSCTLRRWAGPLVMQHNRGSTAWTWELLFPWGRGGYPGRTTTRKKGSHSLGSTMLKACYAIDLLGIHF